MADETVYGRKAEEDEGSSGGKNEGKEKKPFRKGPGRRGAGILRRKLRRIFGRFPIRPVLLIGILLFLGILLLLGLGLAVLILLIYRCVRCAAVVFLLVCRNGEGVVGAVIARCHFHRPPAQAVHIDFCPGVGVVIIDTVLMKTVL